MMTKVEEAMRFDFPSKNGEQLSGKLELSHEKIHADYCKKCETTKGKVDRIMKHIEIKRDLSDEERQRMLEVAENCPVNRTLKSEVIIGSPAK